MKGVVSTSPPLDEKTDSKEMPSCTGEVKARCDEGDVPVKLSVAPGYNDKYHSLTIGKVNNEGSCLTDFKINPPSSFNFDSVDEPDKSICVEARKGIPPLCKQYDCRPERRVETYKPYCDARDTSWNAVPSVNFGEAFEEQGQFQGFPFISSYVFCLQKEQRYSIIARSEFLGKGWYQPIEPNPFQSPPQDPIEMRLGSILKLESADDTSNLIFQPSEVVENGYGSSTTDYYRGLDKVSPIPDYSSFTAIPSNVPSGEENDWYTFWGSYTSEIEFMICPETSNGAYKLINNTCVLECNPGCNISNTGTTCIAPPCDNAILSSCSEESTQNIVAYFKHAVEDTSDTGLNTPCGNAILAGCSEESVQNIVEYTKQLHSC